MRNTADFKKIFFFKTLTKILVYNEIESMFTRVLQKD